VKSSTTILCVDDYKPFLLMLAWTLQIQGYQVIAVTDPRQALVVATTGADVSLVITDFTMPHMSGEAIDGVRERGKGPPLSQTAQFMVQMPARPRSRSPAHALAHLKPAPRPCRNPNVKLSWALTTLRPAFLLAFSCTICVVLA
jgi:CheY-like chemotaxis protein